MPTFHRLNSKGSLEISFLSDDQVIFVASLLRDPPNVLTFCIEHILYLEVVDNEVIILIIAVVSVFIML